MGCAVFKNYIYAVGGRDDSSELNSAERYNPNTNQWQPVVSMKSKRSGVGLSGIKKISPMFEVSKLFYQTNINSDATHLFSVSLE